VKHNPTDRELEFRKLVESS